MCMQVTMFVCVFEFEWRKELSSAVCVCIKNYYTTQNSNTQTSNLSLFWLEIFVQALAKKNV